MATVWCYTPKDPKANKIVVEGIIVTKTPGVRSVGQPHAKLEPWINKLVRVSILPNAAKTDAEQKKEVLKNSTQEAAKQVDNGPEISEHAKEPDLGNLDNPALPTLAEVKTMNFKELRDYADKSGVHGARNSKKSYVKALVDAGKVKL